LECPKDIDPAYKGHHETHETAAAELEHYRQKLGQMQTLLYAERKHGILIVLQALDAGGKDGTVDHVFAAFNPQGASVTGFKQRHPWNSRMTSSGVCIRMRRPRMGVDL